MTAEQSKERILHDQMLRIEQQRREIAHLRAEVAELEELLDLEKRLNNEIIRKHYEDGGHALRIDLRRIVNDGRPIILCYEEIPNYEIGYTVLRAVR